MIKPNTENITGKFQNELQQELDSFLSKQAELYPSNERLTIDLHCHDHNSDKPDEIMGKILNLPETWLPTEKLILTLQKNGCNAFTITNHNNARSCFNLQEQGADVLTGAEFSCMVPDYGVGIHVLAYGFTLDQEKSLLKLRGNLYAFLEYSHFNNLPTIWAHPLYHYSSRKVPSIDFFRKLSIVFERFEILNGQRDTWQNMLIKNWLVNISSDDIDKAAEEFSINIENYCTHRYRKSMSGGSDSHMGIFSGLTGTYLYVPDLQDKLAKSTKADLALEALREGRMAPYGSHNNSEKLTITFLDYIMQIALYYKDPGLMRILLHKGSPNEKLMALVVSNCFAEIKQHKVTTNFIRLLHECFLGVTPGFAKKYFIPKIYKPIFNDAIKIAQVRRDKPDEVINAFSESICSINYKLGEILSCRLNEKFAKSKKEPIFQSNNLNELIESFELPSYIRAYTDGNESDNPKRMRNVKVSEFLDGLSFPFFASAIITAAHFTSARVLYNVRPLLNAFSEEMGKLQHPKRMLWLADIFDENDSSWHWIQSLLSEINRNDLPIDILVCSNSVSPDNHLRVVPAIAEFNFPVSQGIKFQVPNLLVIHNLFHTGEYDRVLCSSEGIMGLIGIYLKNAYSVPSYFYMQKDMLSYVNNVFHLNKENMVRVRKFLRLFYKNFDTLFVMNKGQQQWITGKKMDFNIGNVCLTSQWADEVYNPRLRNVDNVLNLNKYTFVLVYSGKTDKGHDNALLESIYKKIHLYMPNIQLVITGEGPVEKKLKETMPDAVFPGHYDEERLAEIYASSDLLILPSHHDSFGRTIIEAFSCGLPVIDLRTKSSEDLIRDGINGFLVDRKKDIIQKVIDYYSDYKLQLSFKKSAFETAKSYKKENILRRFLEDVGIDSFSLK